MQTITASTVESLRIKWLSLFKIAERDDSVENRKADDDAWDAYVDAIKKSGLGWPTKY